MEIHEQLSESAFVSIRETVELIAEERNVDIEIVAGYIHRLLSENCTTGERPRFFAMDRIKQCLIKSNDDFVVGRLREIERTGLFLDIRTGDGRRYCSDFGFLRHEISKFLGIPALFVVSGTDIVVAKADESPKQRRSRLVQTVNELCAAKGISINKAFDELAGGEFGGKSNISIMYYPRKKQAT